MPENVTVTGALYQPFPFGPRSAEEPVTDGRVLVDLELELKASESRCRRWPSIGSVSELEWNVTTVWQVDEVAPGVWIETVTSLTYQPLLPGVPEVTE